VQWEASLLAILDCFEGRAFTIKELVELLLDNTELTQALPDELADEDRKGSLQRRLGVHSSSAKTAQFGTEALRRKLSKPAISAPVSPYESEEQ
jgi:hypothetical protein